jgi:predicted metalloprotease with PDZ domain
MPDPQARIVVTKAGAAEAAGLKSGERIVAVDGAPPTLSVFVALSDRLARGEVLTLQVAGVDGAQRQVVVPPTESTIADKPIAGVSPAWNQVVGLRDVDGLQGLDLRVGDRLRQVNGQWILQHYDLDRALAQANGAVEVVVEREDSVLRLSSTLDNTAAARFVKCIALGQASGSNRVWARAGGAAAQAGVLNGDRIVKIGEARVADF